MMLVSRRHFLAMALSLPVVASAAVNAPSQAGSTDLVETMLTRAHVPRHSNELWVLVDDQDATLSVFRGNALVDRFAPISLGRAGAKTQRVRGDNVTPKGEFRINRFNYESQWQTFIGIDFPTQPMLAWRWKKGFIPKLIMMTTSITTDVTAIHRKTPLWVGRLAFTAWAAQILIFMGATIGPRGVSPLPTSKLIAWWS